MKNNYLSLIVIATIFGLLAGTAGALFANFYSVSTGGSLSLNRELNLSNYLSPNLVIRDPKKVVVNQDVKTDETIRDLRTSLLGVFVKNVETDEYYELQAPFAWAVAATTDGWVMVTWPEATSKLGTGAIAKNFVVIDSARKSYEIEEVIIAPITLGDFVFLHLKEASSLNVRRLVPETEIKTGQSLLLALKDESFLLNALGSKKLKSSLLSSDVYSQELSLAYAVENEPAFVFNLTGEMIGVIDRQGKWLSAPELNTYWRSLLKNKSLQWPSLGLNYLNLASVVGANDLPEKGAKLQNTESFPAIVKDGPADQAGLKAGDIITRFNGTEINGENDLSVLLSAYSPGDSIILNYLRDDLSFETEVVLGEVQ